MDKNNKNDKPKKLNEKALTALLAVGVAILLWLYVVTIVSPNSDGRYTNIPVTLQGAVILQERGLMITTEELPKASLHLEGNRTDLNKLNSSNISISVDVSGIGAPGIYDLKLGNPSFPSDVPNTAITVLSKDPGTIRIEVERRVNKPVPVEIVYNDDGFDSENYMADKENRQLDSETVTVTGPQSVIDQIAMARIEVNLENRIESLSEQYSYTLCDEKGEPVDVEKVVTDTDSVTLTLKIVRVKEVELTLNIVPGGGATAENTTVTIDPKTILVSGGAALLEDLDKLELGTVDLGELTEDQELVFPIKLPEGITNETGVNEATVTIAFPQLATKTLTISNIEAVNIPEGMDVKLAAKQLEVMLRGPVDVVDKLLPEQVKVQVDCTEAQLGAASLKAEILISVEGVGAVGVYTVTATVKNK